MNSKAITLSEFISQNPANSHFSPGDFESIMQSIVKAANVVNREVNRAGLVDILGAEETTNISGEEQQKLDIFANDQFIKTLQEGGKVSGLASEENDDFVDFNNENGEYIMAMDPLDGSSNIDVNVSIGTIYGIFKRKTTGPLDLEEFFKPGNEQISSGYILYGSSTMLVFTTGNGVNGFTLDPSTCEFCLSHPDMKIPESGKIYSINEGNFELFPEGVKRYVKYCQEDNGSTKKPYSARYIGSLVADFHRNLLKGGIFMYPSTQSAPNGKLRLLYECNPLSYVVEQAGGKATNGSERILDLKPEELHQRTPYFIGSANMVDKVAEFIQENAIV